MATARVVVVMARVVVATDTAGAEAEEMSAGLQVEVVMAVVRGAAAKAAVATVVVAAAAWVVVGLAPVAREDQRHTKQAAHPARCSGSQRRRRYSDGGLDRFRFLCSRIRRLLSVCSCHTRTNSFYLAVLVAAREVAVSVAA